MERGLINGSDAPALAERAASTRNTCWRAHDLLRVTRLVLAEGEPDWVREAFARAPWVVVRRAVPTAQFVAVGIRGVGRAQRFGALIHIQDIESICAPETLLHAVPRRERRVLPAFAALAGLRTTASALEGYAWGPTGSAGFELATGVVTASTSSDLDLLVRMPEQPDAVTIRALSHTLARAAERAGTRVDAQLETPAGGVALNELASGAPRVLARANDGPRLIENPWHRS